jgi:hypothetical protein
MLIGLKRKFAPVKAWFDGFSVGKPSVYPLIIVGDAGVGKSTIALAYAEQIGFDPIISTAESERHTDALKRLFGDSRMPTFFGQKRCLIMEDLKSFGKREWTQFDEPMKNKSFPLILITTNEAEIPWRIRKQGLVHRVEPPTEGDLSEYLNREREQRSMTTSDAHLRWIASASSTWRQSLHLLLTTPDGWRHDNDSNPPQRFGHGQVEDILLNKHRSIDFSVHPLAIIQAADFNGANPDYVIRAMLLHSKAWVVEGLSEVSRAYCSTLRAPTATKPPFKKREIRGSSRIV